MKKIFRNPICMFILGLIVMASIVGVYAINASEITYKETTVEGAIDNLYTDINDYKSITFNLYSHAHKSAPYAQGLLFLSDFKTKFSYFKILELTNVTSFPATCELVGYVSGTGEISMDLNTEYQSNQYDQIIVKTTPTSTTANARCYARVQLYN